MPEHIIFFLVSAVDDLQKVSLCLLDGVSYPLSLDIVLPLAIYSASVGFLFFFFLPLIRKETIDFYLLIDNLCRLPLCSLFSLEANFFIVSPLDIYKSRFSCLFFKLGSIFFTSKHL